MNAPAQVKGEHWLVHKLLCNHVVKNIGAQNLCKGLVTHSQNTVKLRRQE